MGEERHPRERDRAGHDHDADSRRSAWRRAGAASGADRPHPVGRFCTEEEIAGLASYLASPQAEVTGQTLLMDGGLSVEGTVLRAAAAVGFVQGGDLGRPKNRTNVSAPSLFAASANSATAESNVIWVSSGGGAAISMPSTARSSEICLDRDLRFAARDDLADQTARAGHHLRRAVGGKPQPLDHLGTSTRLAPWTV